MEIYGKNIGFFMSVGATAKLAKECKDGDISNLAEVFNLPQGEQLEKTAEFVCILAEAEENRKYFEACGNYDKQTITVDEILSLPADKFTELQTEMLDAINAGAHREIETKAPKKAEAVPQSN